LSCKLFNLPAGQLQLPCWQN